MVTNNNSNNNHNNIVTNIVLYVYQIQKGRGLQSCKSTTMSSEVFGLTHKWLSGVVELIIIISYTIINAIIFVLSRG